jgi:hypothetical protein
MSGTLTDRKKALDMLRNKEVSQGIQRNSTPPVACPDVAPAPPERKTFVVPRCQLQLQVLLDRPQLIPLENGEVGTFPILEAGFQSGDIVEVSLVRRREQ